MATLYDTVKDRAKQAGFSIASLEVAAGIANGTISKWKDGRPYADTLKKVADVLKVTVDELI